MDDEFAVALDGTQRELATLGRADSAAASRATRLHQSSVEAWRRRARASEFRALTAESAAPRAYPPRLPRCGAPRYHSHPAASSIPSLCLAFAVAERPGEQLIH
jgi:hypothetical protein